MITERELNEAIGLLDMYKKITDQQTLIMKKLFVQNEDLEKVIEKQKKIIGVLRSQVTEKMDL